MVCRHNRVNKLQNIYVIIILEFSNLFVYDSLRDEFALLIHYNSKKLGSKRSIKFPKNNFE